MTINNATNNLYSGFKNFVINGNQIIWQRGTSISVAVTTATYTSDMWGFQQAAGTVAATISQQSLATNGFQFVTRIQRNNANTNTNNMNFCEVLETANSILLQSQTVTVSFYARSGANYSPTSSLLKVFVNTGTGTDQSLTSMVAGTWTGFSANTGTSVTLTSTLTRFSYTVTLGSTITQAGVQFQMVPTGTAGANDYFEITGIQLETNYVPTAFEFRHFPLELNLCKRWYTKSFLYATTPAQNVGTVTSEQFFRCNGAGATTNITQSLVFPVLMRATPTITIYNPAAANAQARNEGAAGDFSATTVANSTARGFYITATGNAGGIVGHACGFHWTADASL